MRNSGNIVCTACQTEDLTWMADVFAFSKRSGSKYVFSMSLSESTEQQTADGVDGNNTSRICEKEENKETRKR
jgi:hypothetical protein